MRPRTSSNFGPLISKRVGTRDRIHRIPATKPRKTEHSPTLREQTLVLAPDGAVALAGSGLQALAVDDGDAAVRVADQAGGPDVPGNLTAGAVALPAQDDVLSTVAPPRAPGHPPGGRLRVVVSRTRPAPFLPRMAEFLGADLVPLGSAGAKGAAVLQGQADAYVHAGGQYEWDSAAPVAVAWAGGFHASRIDGRELSYNQADLLMPDILVCPPALAGPLLDAIRSAQSGAEGETGGGQR